MWNSIKGRKRCIVVCQGCVRSPRDDDVAEGAERFYEWLKKGKEKVPHFTKRKDGKLMCFAGLWDSVTCAPRLCQGPCD